MNEENLNAIWGNCVDGHYSCYGSSCVESTNLFQQCTFLMIKHDLEHTIIVLRKKSLKHLFVSLHKRFGYNKLVKGNSSAISCLAMSRARQAYFLYKQFYKTKENI